MSACKAAETSSLQYGSAPPYPPIDELRHKRVAGEADLGKSPRTVDLWTLPPGGWHTAGKDAGRLPFRIGVELTKYRC
jgi:hypothetical protein